MSTGEESSCVVWNAAKTTQQRHRWALGVFRPVSSHADDSGILVADASRQMCLTSGRQHTCGSSFATQGSEWREETSQVESFLEIWNNANEDFVVAFMTQAAELCECAPDPALVYNTDRHAHALSSGRLASDETKKALLGKCHNNLPKAGRSVAG